MNCSILKSRSINKHWRIRAFVAMLCLCVAVLSAQVQPRQLRNEVLQSQQAKTLAKPKVNAKSKRSPKPMPTPPPLAPTVNPLNNANATLVYLENTETLSYDQGVNPDMKVMKGNVRFRHDNALLYCDSAYFYENANSINAFSHVRIVQGDTLFVYGDFLFYDGNMKLAKLRGNVKMQNRNTTLTTDSLNFDRITNLAYYYTGGKIVDAENTLTSVWGQYHTTSNDALFKNKVLLVNKNFTMTSDTLQYNTKSNIANLVGPTHIVYNKETDIYSNRGWYNTKTEQMMLLNRSQVLHKDGRTMVGDTIFYDKTKKYGEAFINVSLTDSAQTSTLFGDYVFYDETKKAGLATDSALLLDWSSKDSLWMHADTLRTFKDSSFSVAKATFNVRFFRNDVQGISDSLSYSARDSIMNMYGQPVLWSDNNQLSGDTIKAFTKNKKIERILIQQAAMAVQKEDSLYFNQLSGKEITAHLDSGELRRVDVNGNAETIYYPKDDADSTIVGLNKTESSYVVMHLKNKKVERIVMTAASSGVMYPLGQLKGGDIYLKNFFWIDKQRPLKSSDVLQIPSKEPRIKIGTSSLMGVDAEKQTKGSK
ncbi:MAG: hypothetical protein AUK44_01565 [Porphyromonadaceae bacterium CG2_30_38_12]|nr:MAG: hypothetical protein AUK44_01565 [Porphyromonadaceae bacterium CG2_30_38_12]